MTLNKILVTGSSGTIGTALCEKLLNLKYQVSGVDIKPNKWNKKINEITQILDLRKKHVLETLPKNFDLVIHLAANARVYNLVIDPPLAKDNLMMTFNILDFCRKHNIQKFIFSSSREVYGNTNTQIHSEDESYVTNCESPYTASKIGGEALVHAYQQCYDINFLILRFSNVYGKYDDSDRVIPQFINLTKENKDLTIFGKNKFMDFTYIDDAISCTLKCIEKFDVIQNEVFNVSSGKGTFMTEIAKMITTYMDGTNKIIIKSNRTGEIEKYVANISKAKRKLNYHPRYTIDEGIKKTIKWYLRTNQKN